MSDLAERLREALREAGASQKALAEACHVKPPSVSEWLNGTTKVLKSMSLLRAAAFLRVNALWLASGIGPKSVDPGASNVTQLRADDAPRTTDWPFKSITPARWQSLPDADRQRIEVFAEATLLAVEGRQPDETRRSKR